VAAVHGSPAEQQDKTRMTADGLSGHNRLGDETSPYLLQHKDNPVHWWPWTDDAFAAARAANKPILLSVGYSACHWCHVMAHECFEDDDIAALMNRNFINIKVDREERPDVDAIYMKALSLMGEQGGWPLTIFLSPDGRPFFGGTYFPPTPAYGRPSFPQVLGHIDKVWREQREQVDAQGDSLINAIGDQHMERLRDGLSMALIDSAAERLLDYIDTSAGGMNGAPKFPMPFVFEFLWRAYKRKGDERCRNAVIVTLTRICQGGIYDHVGGGFARYSTDGEWLAPHFEKMLYDNAQLIDLLTLVWQDTQSPLFAARIRETIGWLTREMMGENGAFAASMDADSEGEEGKFYVWSEAEINHLLGADADFFKAVYDVSARGNWEGENILNRTARADAALVPEDETRLAACRDVLLIERAKRIWPGRDDKVLADWNGLTITALTHAGIVFGESAWLDLAAKALRAVCETMTWTDGDGRRRLGHTLCRGRLQHAAMIDDYANMTNAALALHAATGDHAYLAQAEAWVGVANDLYWDDVGSGYFFTASDARDLIVRTKTANDSAVPSGNGSMVFALARLFYLTGTQAFRTRAASAVAALEVEAMKSFPHGATLLNAHEFLESAVQVVVVGSRAQPDTQSLLQAVAGRSVPNLVLDVVSDGAALPPGHPAHGKTKIDGTAAAYVCRGPVCSPPQTTADGLREALVA
jgi:uncharacterized protein YyaL (SSP411 family)